VLIQRVLTAALLGAAVIASVLFLPSFAAAIVLGAFWLLGVREWASFARLGTGATLAFVVAFALLMAATSWFSGRADVVNTALGIALLWWVFAMLALRRYPRAIGVRQTIVAGFATLLPAWTLLAFLHSQSALGPRLLLAMLAIVWAADIGAYAVGRSIGRNKLAPAVSPGKTWEGVIGGLCCAGAVGALAGHLLGFAPAVFAGLGIVTAALSVVGDLNVSMFKRNAGLKDSGRLLPGHGGVLDRIDSVTAAVAIFVLGLALIGIIT